jgi:hypothetical protein
MLDDIALTEQWPVNTGYEDAAIRLSGISASLKDTDGSETLGIAVQAIPAGARLSDGTRSFTATASNTTADVTAWTLNNLSLMPPSHFTGRIDLRVVATATEIATGQTNSTSATLTVNVKPDLQAYQSPLALDLDGDGIHTTALGATEGSFDLMNTGSPIRSGWLSPGDGFLAVDRNANGIIDSRVELFGGEVGEGFAQLAAFDSNRDGIVDARDTRFSELLVWQDLNSDHGHMAQDIWVTGHMGSRTYEDIWGQVFYYHISFRCDSS